MIVSVLAALASAGVGFYLGFGAGQAWNDRCYRLLYPRAAEGGFMQGDDDFFLSR